jgi:hypothetical protein
MNLTPLQTAAALDSIAEALENAEAAFSQFVEQNDVYGKGSAEWYLELAFQQLLVVAEALDLPLLRAAIDHDLQQARTEKLLAGEADPDGNPNLKWAVPARRSLAALRATFGVDPARTVTRDLEAILRAATYSITDPRVHAAPPADESTLHHRLENLLRCVFPDLLHKPRLSKPIKNFEPDSGIPSIQTLLEYKYLSAVEQVGTIADELLADTRGYTARDWSTFIYLIYETHRFKPESEWRQLLRDCGVDARTSVVVISGEPIGGTARKRPSRR